MVRPIADMVIEITIGALRWFSSSIARLHEVIMLDGTRLPLGSAGAGTIIGVGMTTLARETVDVGRMIADQVIALLSCITL